VNSGKILIVDDSENIRSVLQLKFEYLGYRVSTARDGDEALKIIETEHPDVVVLDVMMPRQNGFQVCRKIKSNPVLSDTPIIFLTAKGQKEDRFWGKDCGADEYLTKPFSAAELERVIERLMERRRPLMTMSQFEEEVASRKERGETFSILTINFDAKALNVFRQKYGELGFREALEGIRQTIEVILKDEAGDAMVSLAGDNILKAILPMEPGRAATTKDRIVLQSDLLLKSFYSDQDAGQGFVVARQGAGAREVHVPLLKLETSLCAEDSQGAP